MRTAGATVFGGEVGGETALKGLVTDGGGRTEVGGGWVRTSGEQGYGDELHLLEGAVLEGSRMTLGPVLGEGKNLSLQGAAVFGAAVNGVKNLSVSGQTEINTEQVATTGNQSYGGAVLLGADTTLSSSAGGAIEFGSTVDGEWGLEVNTGGTTTFGGEVGGGRRC